MANIKRYASNLSHNITGTASMGLNYPCDVMEVYPGDSFKLQFKNLTRFMPQISPTTSDVFVGLDVHEVPLRQLAEKIGINWDDFLTGGQNGDKMISAPKITIPAEGYEPGSLADWLGYPCNYTDPDSNEKVIVAAGQTFNAWPVLAYMHIIDSNYLDQNFVQHLDFTKYQEFLDGTYEFNDAAGNSLGYDLLVDGVFPKAWSRDFLGKSMPNTQRGPTVTLPIGETADLDPLVAPVVTGGYVIVSNTTKITVAGTSGGTSGGVSFGVHSYEFISGSVYQSGKVILDVITPPDPFFSETIYAVDLSGSTASVVISTDGGKTWDPLTSDDLKQVSWSNGVVIYTSGSGTVADLSGVKSDLSNASGISMIVFRTYARMQRFGELLQKAGARAVEYTLAMFGVRIPDSRAQRPIFHGSFRMPVVFSEVLQTSQTSDTSPLAYMAGHGITGGVNKPIHVKILEHGLLITIMHIMPRSQYHTFVPNYLLRMNRNDIPNPLFQHVGDQPVLRKQIFPNSANPDEYFGFVPKYSELTSIPSTLHGHMKDTFLHWTMARYYKDEPVLSAKWRYETPSNRSFSVPDEAQTVVQIGVECKARRAFVKNAEPGIHIV